MKDLSYQSSLSIPEAIHILSYLIIFCWFFFNLSPSIPFGYKLVPIHSLPLLVCPLIFFWNFSTSLLVSFKSHIQYVPLQPYYKCLISNSIFYKSYNCCYIVISITLILYTYGFLIAHYSVPCNKNLFSLSHTYSRSTSIF